jgi:hypothetical protein
MRKFQANGGDGARGRLASGSAPGDHVRGAVLSSHDLVPAPMVKVESPHRPPFARTVGR